MIKVSIFYPNAPGSHFDFDYYLDKHVPVVVSLLYGWLIVRDR